MIDFLQEVSTGVMVGSIYALIAVGYVVIFKATGVLSLAQSAFVPLGSFLCYQFIVPLGLPFWAGALLSMAIAFIIGFALERFPVRAMMGQTPLLIFMSTIGIYIFLLSFTALVWEDKTLPYPPIFRIRPISLGVLKFSEEHIWTFFVCVFLVTVLGVFFRFTKLGLCMRAAADGHQIAQSVGIRLRTIVRISWGIGAALAAISGLLFATFSCASLALEAIGLKAMAIAIFGGMNSIAGVIFAGLLVGVFERVSTYYIGHGIGETVAFVILLLILLVRPWGLFGLREIERV